MSKETHPGWTEGARQRREACMERITTEARLPRTRVDVRAPRGVRNVWERLPWWWGGRHGSAQGAGETGPGLCPSSVLWASAGRMGPPQ